MSGKMNVFGYVQLLAEDITRLRRDMKKSLERDHIEMVLRCSIAHEYPEAQTDVDLRSYVQRALTEASKSA